MPKRYLVLSEQMEDIFVGELAFVMQKINVRIMEYHYFGSPVCINQDIGHAGGVLMLEYLDGSHLSNFIYKFVLKTCYYLNY